EVLFDYCQPAHDLFEPHCLLHIRPRARSISGERIYITTPRRKQLLFAVSLTQLKDRRDGMAECAGPASGRSPHRRRSDCVRSAGVAAEPGSSSDLGGGGGGQVTIPNLEAYVDSLWINADTSPKGISWRENVRNRQLAAASALQRKSSSTRPRAVTTSPPGCASPQVSCSGAKITSARQDPRRQGRKR